MKHAPILLLALAGLLGCDATGPSCEDCDPWPGPPPCTVFSGDVVLAGEEDVEALPDCWTVPDHQVTVRGTALVDLTPLSRLREAKSLILDSNPNLLTTEGMTVLHLEDLILRDNPALRRLDLTSVQSIDHELRLEGASSLHDLDAPDLRHLGDLIIQDTTGVDLLEIFPHTFQCVEGDLIVARNQDLTTLGAYQLRGLQCVEGNLVIEDNPLLSDIEGLDSVHRVGRSLLVTGNPHLSRCRAEHLDWTIFEVGGDVSIGENSALYDPC